MASRRRVILVNGTWAFGWWRSRFWRILPNRWRPTEIDWPEIRKGLEEVGTVESFVWSGENSHQARIESGKDLAEHLKRILEQSKDEQIYVVAHSHGGNVALYALADHELRKQIAGLVCLATPFLNFHPQNLDMTALFRAFFAFVFVVTAVTSFFALLILSVLFVNLNENGSFYAILIFSVAAAVAFYVPIKIRKFSTKYRWRERLATKVDTYCRSAQPPVPEGQHVFLARKVGDEANAAIVGGTLVELFIAALWRVSGAIVKDLPNWIFKKLKSRVFVIVAIIVVASLFVINAALMLELILWPFLVFFDSPNDIVRWGLMIIIAFACFQLALGILIAFLNILRFGRSDIKITPFVQVTGETTPEGAWKLNLYPVVGSIRLAHSEVYSDPRVISDICDWIRAEDGRTDPVEQS